MACKNRRFQYVTCRTLASLVYLTVFCGNAPAQTLADLFDYRTLQPINITIDPAEYQTLKSNLTDNTYYHADLEWRGVEVKNIGVRQRGRSSRNSFKPSFKFSFDEFEDGQTFLGYSSLSMKSNVQDASQVKEAVSLLFFQRLGIPAARTSHARVNINGIYAGVYTVLEDIDDDFLTANFGDNSAYLYEFNNLPDPYQFGELPGGSYVPAPFDPKTHSKSPQPDLVASLINAINQAPDATFERDVAQYLNWDEFLLELAIESYLAEYDGFLGAGGVNNIYLLRFDKSTQFFVLPKDKDNTLEPLDNGSVFRNADQNVLVRRALGNPSLKARFLRALAQVSAAAGGPGGWLETEIATHADLIRSSVYEDPNRRCDFNACVNEVFEANVDYNTLFAQQRASLVKTEIRTAGYSVSVQAPRFTTASVVAFQLPSGRRLGTIYGLNLAAETKTAPDSSLPVVLGGTLVYMNGYFAPLLYVSPSQINFEVPQGWTSSSFPLTVVSGSSVSESIQVTVLQ